MTDSVMGEEGANLPFYHSLKLPVSDKIFYLWSSSIWISSLRSCIYNFNPWKSEVDQRSESSPIFNYTEAPYQKWA